MNPFEQFRIVLIKLLNIQVYDIDLSLTNNTLMLVSIVSIVIILQYLIGKHYVYIVSNYQYIVESLYTFILTIVFEQATKYGYRYFPHFYTIFILILLYNLCGLIPFSFTVSSHVIITFTLALSYFIGWIIIGVLTLRQNFIYIFCPKNMPLWLLPLLICVEFLSFCLRPVSLGIRLFANMLAGLDTATLICVTPLITLPKDYTSLPSFFSFNVFSHLVTAFYIFSLFTYFLVPYIFYIITRYIIDKQYQKRFIIIFFSSSIVFFTIPLVLLITSIIISIPSLFFYLHYNFKHKFFHNLFSLIVSFLARQGILQFLLKLHTKLFNVISDFQFIFLMNNLFIFSLAYTVISRFYLFFVITGNLSLFSLNNILLLNVTLFLCLFMWCLRLIVNLCFFIGSSKQSFIHLFGEDIPPSSPSPQSSPQPSSPLPPHNVRNLSLWNRHTYHNYNSFARPRWYYLGNLTLGTCTLLLGCAGTYIAYQMWQVTIESNRTMDRNSDAIQRQTDQADVDAGRMNEQAYIDKWFPKSK